MKGQVVASIFAVEAILKQGALPVNLKFMIEGEEEIGSPSLGAYIEENKELLACDVALNPDAGMLGEDLPTIPTHCAAWPISRSKYKAQPATCTPAFTAAQS